MDAGFRTVARFVSGNVFGAVCERNLPDGFEVDPDTDRLVAIGMIDDELAERQPFPTQDMETVARKLYACVGGKELPMPWPDE
jgi:ferredoxin